MRTYYLGIDPGVTGALALVGPEGDARLLVDVPSMTVKVGGRERNDYDIPAMLDTLRLVNRGVPIRVILEKVGVMPTDGKVGAFSFGKGYGAWQALLHAIGLPFTLVSPLVWKREFGLLGCNKDASRAYAIQLFPTLLDRLKRVKDHNRADALLLAEWGRQTQAGELLGAEYE